MSLPRELEPEERTILGHTIWHARRENQGRTPHGLLKSLASRYRISRRHLRRIAALYDEGVKSSDMRVMRSRPRSGRPRKVDDAIMTRLTEFAQEMNWDFSWDEASHHIGGVSAETLRRSAKSAGWRSVYGRIIPTLTPQQIHARLKWAQKHRRQTWSEWIDIDEKWFYTIVKRKKKVPRNVLVPMGRTQSRRFIGKTMFLAAVARPRPEVGFNGRIGIWRFAEESVARRSSKYRPKGATIIQNFEVTAPKFLEMVRDRLLPAIRRKMPWAKKVTVQMDGPKVHVGGGNLKKFKRLGKDASVQVDFVVQPSQSPDTNVLDLGVFNHLQTVVDRSKRQLSEWDVEKCSFQVLRAFKNIPENILTSMFEKKSEILREIRSCGGDNTFVVPHRK